MGLIQTKYRLVTGKTSDNNDATTDTQVIDTQKWNLQWNSSESQMYF